MFQELLKDIVDRTEGALAGLVMGMDGIMVDSYVRPNSDGTDIETIGMEHSVILKDIRRAAEMLEASTANEVAISAEKMTTVMRLINEEYFVVVTVKPQGNYGKARFLLRTHAPKLLDELTV